MSIKMALIKFSKRFCEHSELYRVDKVSALKNYLMIFLDTLFGESITLIDLEYLDLVVLFLVLFN